MITYAELVELRSRSEKKDDAGATVELALLMRSDYARIKLGECIRLLHALLFKTIALQLSQSYKSLLEKVPSIATTANKYKADPSFSNLQNLIDILVAVGNKISEDMAINMGIVVSRAFQTAAKDIDAITSKIIREYADNRDFVSAVKPFKEKPTFRTFVEMAKQLNDSYKSYCDDNRCEEYLMHAVYQGSTDAVKYMKKYYNAPIAELREVSSSNHSLLGKSYMFSTIWDKAKEDNSFYPIF